jgi:cGMP-dependent protein kinase
MVKSGSVQVMKDGVALRNIVKNDYFGERSVLTNDVRTASVISVGESECWVLHQSDFLTIVDESISKMLIKRIQLQDDSITLEDLAVVKLLGKGMFGCVFLVVHKVKKSLYAFKAVQRRKIRMFDIAENLQLERRLLLQVDHIFIMKLVKTFKDDKHVYFLTELVNGQDLFDVIRVLGLLKESECKFYSACLLLILEHLHEKGIVYRDLKPENVMVDDQGYPKLIDFGTAKLISGRTFTIVGTPHYMAPEVVLGKGYGLPADIWSLGIMLYEFICGGVPFGEEEEDPFAIYDKILHETLRYPASLPKGNHTRMFIEALLNKNPAVRSIGGIPKLKEQKWFFQFDWVNTRQEKLSLKQLPPPLVPKTKDLTDEIARGIARREPLNVSIEVKPTQEEEAMDNSPSQEEQPEPPDWDKEF